MHHSDRFSVHSSIRKINNGRYDLNPTYQRNSVWTKPQKQLLIDSVLSDIPIPSIYLNKISEDRFDVVDGQQRLRTLLEFNNDEFKTSEDSIVGAKFFSELSDNDQDKFTEYQLTMIILHNWVPDKIEDMFLRLQDGSPLNAAEKRRAISGTFRDVVRELSSHSFFNKRVGFNNQRYAFEDAVAKALHLKISQSGNVPSIDINAWTKISGSAIKKTYQNNDTINLDNPHVKAVKRAYNFLNKGFKLLDDFNPKLKKWSSYSLPLVYCELELKYELRNHEKEIAEAYLKLQELRALDNEKDEEQQDPNLANLKNASRADDPANLKFRHEFIYNWMLENVSLEPKNLDPRRLFNSEQRLVIYRRSNGLCQLCKDEIDQDNFEADHIIRHTDGGSTSIDNGRALCVNCNRTRG